MRLPLPDLSDPQPEMLALRPFESEASWLDLAAWIVVSIVSLGLVVSALL